MALTTKQRREMFQISTKTSTETLKNACSAFYCCGENRARKRICWMKFIKTLKKLPEYHFEKGSNNLRSPKQTKFCLKRKRTIKILTFFAKNSTNYFLT